MKILSLCPRRALLLVFLFSVTLLALNGVTRLHKTLDPGDADTGAYLSAASKIHDSGGVLSFLPNCLNSTYREANRHPLYLLVLSIFSKRDISFFVTARWVSFWIGILAFAWNVLHPGLKKSSTF